MGRRDRGRRLLRAARRRPRDADPQHDRGGARRPGLGADHRGRPAATVRARPGQVAAYRRRRRDHHARPDQRGHVPFSSAGHVFGDTRTWRGRTWGKRGRRWWWRGLGCWGVRSLPVDLVPERLGRALAEGWRLAGSIEYVPEGGGSYHWKLTGDDGQSHFVTVDDLDGKDWLGGTKDAVFEGLGRALGTAAALRYGVGLEFVVAPIAASDGGLLRRLDDRYTVCVFPFLAGRSYRFGPYTDARLRRRALDMIAALHRSTPAVRGSAAHHVPRIGGRADLDAFLLDPARPWDRGPFSEAARRLLVPHTADLAQLATGF